MVRLAPYPIVMSFVNTRVRYAAKRYHSATNNSLPDYGCVIFASPHIFTDLLTTASQPPRSSTGKAKPATRRAHGMLISSSTIILLTPSREVDLLAAAASAPSIDLSRTIPRIQLLLSRNFLSRRPSTSMATATHDQIIILTRSRDLRVDGLIWPVPEMRSTMISIRLAAHTIVQLLLGPVMAEIFIILHGMSPEL